MPKDASKPTNVQLASTPRLSDRQRRPTRKVLEVLSENSLSMPVDGRTTETNTASNAKPSTTFTLPHHHSDLQGKVSSLEASGHRLKKKLLSKAEEIDELKAEVQAAKHDSEELEQRIDEAQETMATLKKENKRALETVEKEKERYRKWWLNEIQFTKLLLSMDSTPNRDQEVVKEIQKHYHN
ncbi:hypothetical protein FA15DRAFT_707244 [Coprinopsis marcescibilis]|uniref:Uncharacterized protein n=1 Tax=Coprinopsis marcescibilis TaxID=230819 RepID=A0A5C3KM10_COPMA|nr:hypothetical protein FA15DRAFT_707244 [Coprinopsis marcescibilis]